MALSEDSEILLAERLAATSTPSDQALRSEIRHRVRQAISQLPEADREVIVLKHLEELSFQETAAVLEITMSAVYSRYYPFAFVQGGYERGPRAALPVPEPSCGILVGVGMLLRFRCKTR